MVINYYSFNYGFNYYNFNYSYYKVNKLIIL